MSIRSLLRWASSFLVALAALSAHAAPVKTEYVEAELVSEQLSLVPGQPAWIGLRLKHTKDWHTYWRNPGDSGLPTKIEWQLPPGYTAGPIEWPVPKRIPVPPLANYGYEGEVLLLTELQVPRTVFGGSVRLKARADWLVCKTVCIPDGADLELELPVVQGSPAPDPRFATLFAATRSALPAEVSGFRVSGRATGDATIDIALSPVSGGGTVPKSAYFFSSIEGLVEPSRGQAVRVENGAVVLTVPVAVQLEAVDRRIEGVLVAEPPLPGNPTAVAIRGSIEGTVVAGKPNPARGHGGSDSILGPEQLGGGSSADLGFLTALIFAFAGGLILNLMPCVFPVLSIKILGFAEQAHGDRQLMPRNSFPGSPANMSVCSFSMM